MTRVKKYDDGGDVDKSIPSAPLPSVQLPLNMPFAHRVEVPESTTPIPDWVKKEEKRQGLKKGGAVKPKKFSKGGSVLVVPPGSEGHNQGDPKRDMKPSWRRW